MKANGDVRLRSVLSFSISGSLSTPSLIICLLGAARRRLAGGDVVDDAREHRAHEHRDDRRRRFVRAEAVLVAGRGDAGAQQARVLVHALQHRGEEDEEAQVLVRRLARLEQVDAVELVSSAAIDIDQLQCLPEPLMPANGFSCSSACRPWRSATRRSIAMTSWLWSTAMSVSSKQRRHLELARRDFVVPRDDRHAELVQLVLDLGDARLDALGNAAEVVILELLAARRRRADRACGRAITRSGRSAKCARSMRKYSCSAPSVVKTRCTPLSPRSSSSSIALLGEDVASCGAAASSRRALRRCSR